ncbi:MAG: hypothetical protein KDH96_03675 [Candidatus Riesia sp.]|nr:hypothetical protein [Candidatus Riesia sp.]
MNKLLFFGYPLDPCRRGAKEIIKNRLCAIYMVRWTSSLFAAPLFDWNVSQKIAHHIGTIHDIECRQSNLTYLLT